jgi:drug/metabolite transporter (DMT)-like permease
MSPAQSLAQPLDRRAMLLVVLLCLAWGLYQVSVKVAAAEVPPVMQAGLRSLGSVVLLMGWCRARGIRLAGRDGTLWPGLIAGLLFAVEFAFIYLGLRATDVSRGTLLIYTAPFVVAVGAHLVIPGDRLTAGRVVGLMAAFGGLILVFCDADTWSAPARLGGDAMCILGAIAWGATTLLIKASRLAAAPAEKILFYQLAVSGLLLPPASILLGEPTPQFGSWPTVLAMAYQIIAVSFVSYIAWFWLITQYAPSRLSAFTFLTPVFGVLFGGVLLGEEIGPQLAGALVLIGCGIYLVNNSRRSNAKGSIE